MNSRTEPPYDTSPAPWLDRIDAYPTQHICGFQVRPGRLFPFGATEVPSGINFSIYSNHATSVVLVLFRRGEAEPMAELPFPASFRIGSVFAMTVFGLELEEVEYGYRVAGPFQPGQGHRFEPARILLDPYAKMLSGGQTWGKLRSPGAVRGLVAYEDFDWEDDGPLQLPYEDLVIYELHVRGFTRHESSGVRAAGTFAGLTEKIPYLRQLGINCVELMPVFEFNELDNVYTDPVSGLPLWNYWGYSPVSFFAPKAAYAATGRQGMQIEEFKNMVKQLHQAGIEVILDVVFNHTAEGNEKGPVISFRGIDNKTFYMMAPDGSYLNFSGTGNTLNCNHPVVRGFVLDCLRHWAGEFHVDGFRFDLASILGRAPDGTPLSNPPLLETLAHDPVLRNCKLIAEAWDAAGIYQVGSFPSYHRWSEWNGRYRDAIRRFIKGDDGTAAEMATRLAGSADLYERRGAAASVNFITAHDGFTLRDLISYNEKHNEANGEQNQDGDNSNNSWNCGHEGETDDPEIQALRGRQARNALLLLLTSRGIPMLQAGDEAGRTQHGNNNGYCHDEPSWFDWSLVQSNESLVRFTRLAIAFRRAHPVLCHVPQAEPPDAAGAPPGLSWHGQRAWVADWSPQNHLLAAMFYAAGPVPDCVFIAANADWRDQALELPAAPGGLAWQLFADTGLEPPAEICEPGAERPLAVPGQLNVKARSTVILTGRAVSPATHRDEES